MTVVAEERSKVLALGALLTRSLGLVGRRLILVVVSKPRWSRAPRARWRRRHCAAVARIAEHLVRLGVRIGARCVVVRVWLHDDGYEARGEACSYVETWDDAAKTSNKHGIDRNQGHPNDL